MNIKIIDYNKKHEKDIDETIKIQWNESFTHKEKVFGKVALVDNKFAGVCYGWKEKNFFYLNTLCVRSEYRKCGIGTKLLEAFINKIKLDSIAVGGG